MPKSKLKSLYILILIVIIAAVIITLVEDPTNISLLVKGGVLIVGYIAAITSLERKRRAAYSKHYEKKYDDMIGHSFVNDPSSRKKLMDAIILYNSDRYDAAVAKLDDLRKHCTTPADHSGVLIFRALCFDERNLREEAIRTYEEFLKYDDQNSRAWSNLGLNYAKNGDYDRAENAYRNAIRADDQYVNAYINYASLLLDVEEMEEAMECLEKTLKIDDKQQTALGFAYIACARLEENDKAREYLDRYVAAGGDRSKLEAIINLDEE